MGKRITQQARGKGSLTFRVRGKAYRYKITYPKLNSVGKAKIVKLFNSAGHTAPLIKVVINDENFIVPATDGIYEGQEISIGEGINPGNILKLKDIPQGTKVFNIESAPGKGGKVLRSAGSSASVLTKDEKGVEVLIRRRKLKFNENCRATIGVAAGEGRLIKPVVKAGKKHHMMKSQGRKWHRTSAVKVNALDHPFGGGRGKRIKSKIAKRNSPPGRKVGHLSPKRTGKKR
ncbi:50S ribosomal protein L2 [archaeon]|jgi:large subunit ribosomal protein L2|nr:50S ribosomal protein L2 [archaeon]MBT4242129.1 50S ribosomal protein L2 [archaeon]MBT4417817.1 50S ribosomal protein L2 [archaeon]